MQSYVLIRKFLKRHTIVQDNDRVVAYVVPTHPSDGLDVADLKRYLSESVPRFMLPAGIMVLPELPKTVNGKLDESALPQWSPGRSDHLGDRDR